MCLALKECVWACPTEGCVERCKQDATAAATSAFEGFYGCGVLAGCDTVVCGDGRCRPGEACDDDCLQDTSCYGRCNFIFDSGKPCQCDANCGDNNDCCVDFAEICEPSLATCGDSVCEPPTESLSTCVFDCGDDVDKCLAFVCKTEFAACYSQPDCSVLRRCLDACSGENRCTSQCFLNASDSAALALQALLGCGERGACF